MSAAAIEWVAADATSRSVLETAQKLTETATTVLITGESGTGKDQLARWIHDRGPRRDAPFLKIDCASLPSELVESELFGHERGAFTGAVARKPGRLEMAQGGTIVLDEVAALALAMQAKLLRVLEEQCFRRLGGLRDINVDLRIIAATNKNLREAVKEGAFRQDLYYRLNVIQLVVPPLRERPQDILPLAHFFIDHYNRKFKRQVEGFSSDAESLLLAHDWPGNVRELRNAVERAMILEESTLIHSASLPIAIRSTSAGAVAVGASAGTAPGEGMSLVEQEKRLLIQALEKSGGNQTQAARLLRITRDTLRYKMKKFNLR